MKLLKSEDLIYNLRVKINFLEDKKEYVFERQINRDLINSKIQDQKQYQ